LTFAAMLAAISTVLMFMEFPLPFLPPFLELDLSDIPVLIGAFVLGPLPAVAIALVKDLIHLSVSHTGGVGELADFIVTGAMALAAGYIYRIRKSTRFSIIGGIAGILAMMAFGAISNLYLILPFYSKIMPIAAILALCAKVNPVITSVNSYILYAVLPFNLLKGVIITAFTLIVYRGLSAAVFKRSVGASSTPKSKKEKQS
jgi:riboflavin transporter FmnP